MTKISDVSHLDVHRGRIERDTTYYSQVERLAGLIFDAAKDYQDQHKNLPGGHLLLDKPTFVAAVTDFHFNVDGYLRKPPPGLSGILAAFHSKNDHLADLLAALMGPDRKKSLPPKPETLDHLSADAWASVCALCCVFSDGDTVKEVGKLAPGLGNIAKERRRFLGKRLKKDATDAERFG